MAGVNAEGISKKRPTAISNSAMRSSRCDDPAVIDRAIDGMLDAVFWIREQLDRRGETIGPGVALVGLSVVYFARGDDLGDWKTIALMVGIVLLGLAIAGYWPFHKREGQQPTFQPFHKGEKPIPPTEPSPSH